MSADRTGPTRPSVFLAVLPFVIVGAVALADVLAGPSIGLLPLLSLGPALAAVAGRPWHAALAGGVALLLCAVIGSFDSVLDHRRGLIALVTVAGTTAAAVIASAGRERRERELASLRAVAEAAQRVILRPVPDDPGSLHAAVRYAAAAAAARIGGDLYEVIVSDGVVRLILGDVQGKGLPAVQTAATVLGSFRETAYDAPDLAMIAARIELALAHQGGDRFVTAVLAQFAADGSRAEILNCGHPAPLLVRAGTARPVEPEQISLPLGLAQLAISPLSPLRSTFVEFGPADQLLFYTDGISEARDAAGQFYPLGQCGPLISGPDLPASLGRLAADVARHAGRPLDDDAAMLLISRAGQPSRAAPPPVRISL